MLNYFISKIQHRQMDFTSYDLLSSPDFCLSYFYGIVIDTATAVVF